jgi:hypothetical protein
MIALVDSEEFKMPMTKKNEPMFQTDFFVNIHKPGVQVWVTVPEYMSGSNLDNEQFQYQSCGLLKADLNEIIDEYIEDYKLGYNELPDVEVLSDTLIEMAKKLKNAIQLEHCELIKDDLKEKLA